MRKIKKIIKLCWFIFKHPKKIINVLKTKGIIACFKIAINDSSKVFNVIDGYNIDMNTNKIVFKNFNRKTKIKFAIAKSPTVSIIIPVYNNFNLTYNCLRALKSNINFKAVPYEIIIIDDNSNDKTCEINNICSGIKLIKNCINQGYLKNVNEASIMAKGKYLLFLNNDTYPQKGFLDEMLYVFRNVKNVGIVGSKLIYPNFTLQEAGGIVWNNAEAANYGNSDDPDKPQYNYIKEVDYVSGACLLIEKKLFEKVGRFDESFMPAYYEDTDLCFKIKYLYNKKVIYNPFSQVVHFEGMSNGNDLLRGVKKYQATNKLKFLKKWDATLKKNNYPYCSEYFYARDKSKNKKTILFIDRSVPCYDKDAGSKCVFNYIKLYLNLGFNVKFYGDDNLYIKSYTNELQKLGVEVLYGFDFKRNWKNYIKKYNNNIDYVFLNRPTIAINYINYLKKFSNIRIIYFGHDLHWLRLKRDYDVSNDRNLLTESFRMKKIEEKIFKKSDLIYYPSEVEVEIVKKINMNYNVKQLFLYAFDKIVDNAPRIRQNLLFVGGFNHKPNIDACFWFVDKIFPIIRKTIDVKLLIVGSNPTKEIQKLKSKYIETYFDVSEKELNNYYNSCAVFVAPLRFGAGVKGKIIEAMYHQIPVVTTSVGSEGIPNSKNNFIISDTPEEFANSVIKIILNKDLKEKIVYNSKTTINNYFSKEVILKKIREDLSTI